MNVSLFPTLKELSELLFPEHRITPALDLICSKLEMWVRTPRAKIAIALPPQEGKSTLVSRLLPLYILCRRPKSRIVISSYSDDLSTTHNKACRDMANDERIPILLRNGIGRQDSWYTKKSGYVKSVGVGTGLSGHPADYMIIDDPIKDRIEADSPRRREIVWDWYTDVAIPRMSPQGRMLVLHTRWNEDDLIGRLVERENWEYVRIPAQADTDDDLLGRKFGEYLDSARDRTDEQWAEIKAAVGSRTWQALYQGDPKPLDGGYLPRDWWQFEDYDELIGIQDGQCWVKDVGRVITSWDLTFKGDQDSDFCVGQAWYEGRNGYHLLDQIRGKWDFPKQLEVMRMFMARWPQAHKHLVEDKANGSAAIASLQASISGLVPVNPRGGKEIRVLSVQPIIEAGKVWLPRLPWVEQFITEGESFPNGKNDDQVDAMSQALVFMALQKHSATFNVG